MLKAVIYDFDGTLTPSVLPEFKIVEAGGLEGGGANPKFFEEAHELAKTHNIDLLDSVARLILKFAKKSGLSLTDKNLALGADKRQYNPGVEDFLKRLREKRTKNYLLSSGLKAYLSCLEIAPLFTEIFATTLNYDENGEATTPKQVMTVEQKAETLRELAQELNGSSSDCTGMVYIGDGPTDIFALEFVENNGGESILVYHDENSDEVKAVREKDAANAYFPADFRQGSELDRYIDKI